MSDAGFNATRFERSLAARQHSVETGGVAGCVAMAWRYGYVTRDTLFPIFRRHLYMTPSATKR
jgi:hypothetical protein